LDSNSGLLLEYGYNVFYIQISPGNLNVLKSGDDKCPFVTLHEVSHNKSSK